MKLLVLENKVPRIIEITTPENVTIEHELAGVGSRGVAVLIDTLVVLFGIGIFVLVWASFVPSMSMDAVGVQVQIIATVSILLVFSLYFFVSEYLWNGMTLGKLTQHIRVISDNGEAIDAKRALIRNLVRLVDSIPNSYAVGFISILFSSDNKRLGDYAAGTIVVRERLRPLEEGLLEDSPDEDRTVYNRQEHGKIRNLHLVTQEQFELVKGFVTRKAELDDNSRMGLAKKIAPPIVECLYLQDIDEADYEKLIEDIYYACVNERGMR